MKFRTFAAGSAGFLGVAIAILFWVASVVLSLGFTAVCIWAIYRLIVHFT